MESWINPFIYIYIYKDGCCRSKERIRIYIKIRRSTKRLVFFECIYFVLTYVLYICVFPACCFRQRTYVAQGLFNGVLNETWTHSCFHYKWSLVGQLIYIGSLFLFLECVYFGLLYPTLIFDIFIVVCACVCVCGGVGLIWGFTNGFLVCVSEYHGEFCGFKFTGSSFSFFMFSDKSKKLETDIYITRI